jgi:hypothetical protein
MSSEHILLWRLTLWLAVGSNCSPVVHSTEQWLESCFVQLFYHVQESRQDQTLRHVRMRWVVAKVKGIEEKSKDGFDQRRQGSSTGVTDSPLHEPEILLQGLD